MNFGRKANGIKNCNFVRVSAMFIIIISVRKINCIPLIRIITARKTFRSFNKIPLRFVSLFCLTKLRMFIPEKYFCQTKIHGKYMNKICFR